jgi:hypothetical protein
MSDVGKVSFSESAQKQLQLIGGIVSAVLGIIINVTDLINKVPGLPRHTSWVLGGAIFLFGIWMLVKWRTRYSRLLKPDALRLDRENAEHLVGRAEDINNLLQQCLAKQIVFLEGESGSGKSALVRAGLLTKLKDDKSVQPLLLDDWWVNDWERIPIRALKSALMTSGALGCDAKAKLTDGQLKSAGRHLPALADVERELVRINDDEMRTPLIIFDQFDDYQARNRERFLPNKVWLDPATLRQSPFWDMVARLLEQDKLRCLFVTRSDTAAGLSSVAFFGSVPPMRLDRVRSPYIAELLTRLTEGTPTTPVIADPDAGWTKLRERIIRDISEQDVILPQQLKIVLGGIQSLKRLNLKQYERVGGVAGIEAFYVEQQINGTARKVGLAPSQVRALLVNLIDPLNPTKTRFCGKEDLLAVAAKAGGKPVASDELDNALEELERGEMLRSPSDPESGRTTYRLDHDYLIRGVLAAERRADRWHYLLEDRAKAFQDAGTFWKKWKALLPVGTQCRLALARVRGQFRYGNRRGYALWSLARLPARMLGVVGSFVLVFGLLALAIFWNMKDMERARIDSFFKEIHSMTNSREIHAQTRMFEQNVHAVVELWQPEEALAIAGRIIETMRSTSNTDQMSALQEALVDVTSDLKPEEAQTLGSSILREIQNTADTAQINALTRAFAAISFHLRPDNAQALAELIYHAIKGGGDPSQRHALGSALSVISSQLKPEQVGTLDGSIVEAIQGGRTVPLSPGRD